MMHTTRVRICLGAMLAMILMPATLATAQDDSAAATDDSAAVIEGNIRDFYQKWRSGDVEGAMAHMMVGCNGYLPDGALLGAIPTPASHAAAVSYWKGLFDQGLKFNLMPKHIDVRAGSEGAVATYYVDGSVTGPAGKTGPVRSRATLVWLVTDDGSWKIFHYHISDIKSPN